MQVASFQLSPFPSIIVVSAICRHITIIYVQFIYDGLQRALPYPANWQTSDPTEYHANREQLTQCWFLGRAISNAKMKIYFSNEIYGSNFINSNRKLLWFEITKMLIAGFKNRYIVSLIIILGTLLFPMRSGCSALGACLSTGVLSK